MKLERQQRRRIWPVAIAGLAVALMLGCGGGNSGGGRALTVSDYVRVDLGWLGQAPNDLLGRKKAAINNAGDVVMNLRIPTPNGASSVRAFKWSRGALEDIHPPVPDPYSFAVDINDQGQALLFSWDGAPPTSEGVKLRMFLYANGTHTEILPPDPPVFGVAPIALAADGTITGSYAYVAEGDTHTGGFLWRNGVYTLFDGDPITGVNARGQVVVVLERDYFADPTPYALREANGQTTRLLDSDPNAEWFTPFALTDAGVIVGEYHPPDGIGRRLGQFLNGKVESLHNGLEQQKASAINDAGDIVGYSFDGAFLARAGGGVLNFESLFPPKPTPGIDVPRAVNDRGQIAGYYTDTRVDRERFSLFLLTPRTLAPPNGTATVTLGDRHDSRLDESPFEAVSVTGNLVSDRYLSVRVAAKDSASGMREFLCTLMLPTAIETGKSYPVSGSAHDGTEGGVTFLNQKIPPVLQGPHDPYSIREVVFPAESGTLVVDRITGQEITFRLIDIKFGMTLNATITVRR